MKYGADNQTHNLLKVFFHDRSTKAYIRLAIYYFMASWCFLFSFIFAASKRSKWAFIVLSFVLAASTNQMKVAATQEYKTFRVQRDKSVSFSRFLLLFFLP